MRRDITINALFYNLSTSEVEDLTGNGLDDLKNRIIRTPLPAYQTFLDDPLRVLRVIRFATRFAFDFAPGLLEAANNDDIKLAFITKISRERVGVEMEKMLKGNDAHRAISMISNIGFYSLVFSPPEETPVNDQDAVACSNALKDLLENPAHIPWISDITQNDKKHVYLACAISPYRTFTYTIKQRIHPVSKAIVLHALKLSNIDADTTHALLDSFDEITRIMDSNESRVEYGLLLRKIGLRPLLGKWKLAFIVALSIQISKHPSEKMQLIEKYTLFMQKVHAMGLDDAYSLKPLMDGKQIAAALGIKPGPQIGSYLDGLIKWQLENPTKTIADAEVWIKSVYG
jgi:tRNA nucleotidyltransferase (CCA-adding enzyme)